MYYEVRDVKRAIQVHKANKSPKPYLSFSSQNSHSHHCIHLEVVETDLLLFSNPKPKDSLQQCGEHLKPVQIIIVILD